MRFDKIGYQLTLFLCQSSPEQKAALTEEIGLCKETRILLIICSNLKFSELTDRIKN